MTSSIPSSIEEIVREALEQPVASYSSQNDKVAADAMNDAIELIWPFLAQGLHERLLIALTTHNKALIQSLREKAFLSAITIPGKAIRVVPLDQVIAEINKTYGV